MPNRQLDAQSRRGLRDRVVAMLEAGDVKLDGDSKDATPLIDSGKLDSLALFNLALFIEGEVGRQIDITGFDLASEWNTVGDIVDFIATQRIRG